MFFNSPGKPTKIKKLIYLLASTGLGVLLSFIIHTLIEINYLRWVENHGRVVAFYNGCALLPSLQIFLWLLGAVGGFFLGNFWWRKLYIERVWEKRRLFRR